MGGKQFLIERGGYWPWRSPGPRPANPLTLNTEVLVNNRTKRAIVHAVPAGPHQARRAAPEDPALAEVRRISNALFFLGAVVTLAWLTVAGGTLWQRVAALPALELKIGVEAEGVPILPDPPRGGATHPGRALDV